MGTCGGCILSAGGAKLHSAGDMLQLNFMPEMPEVLAGQVRAGRLHLVLSLITDWSGESARSPRLISCDAADRGLQSVELPPAANGGRRNMLALRPQGTVGNNDSLRSDAVTS